MSAIVLRTGSEPKTPMHRRGLSRQMIIISRRNNNQGRLTKSSTFSVVWCGAVRCGAVRCGAVRCGAVRCGAVRCGVVRCVAT